MVKIAVIGGKLQGTEACYLAQKAGYSTLLIEKKKAHQHRVYAMKKLFLMSV